MNHSSPAIAIVGLACHYPDARNPRQLWENALSQRRAFRAIPPQRLDLEDYGRLVSDQADGTYVAEAALLDGFEFDRVKFRVSGSTYRSTDLAHWLALDIASRALADAGFANGDRLPRDRVGVLVGNTLTGEFSRAQQMRLRWPYVRRQVAAELAAEGWDEQRSSAFLGRLEQNYKAPFPAPTEDTLAGGLANTIAGRICNHFDLHGGGYTVDGACASSLLATAQACTALANGDLEMALAGGVDLSLDPFELVGFARNGALSPGEMLVFDQRSQGFLPGEGCGFAVLMRHRDALHQGLRVYAVIRGWGISSDGSGGITRPEVDGQVLALQRAYQRAGFGIDTVDLIEGHGTGTAVGDTTELTALNRARRNSTPGEATPHHAAVGSIKANIGHTKAAAGLASLIKASLALDSQVLPPTTGCKLPHTQITGPASTLRTLRQPEPWPLGRPLRCGVSAMGFGGINSHLVLESAEPPRRTSGRRIDSRFGPTPQDCEMLLFAGADSAELKQKVERVKVRVTSLTHAELGDLAAELARRLPADANYRCALIAATPKQLQERLGKLRQALDHPLARGASHLDPEHGLFLGHGGRPPRIGLLFPGQGSPARLGGGLWRQRFASAAEVYAGSDLPSAGDGVDTAIAQPAIATAALAGLEVLDSLGVHATTAIGHSLGELIALQWAGAYDSAALLRLTHARGQAMAELGEATGAMASLGASAADVARLIDRLGVDNLTLAGLNSPRQTVISGPAEQVVNALEQAAKQGWQTTRLAVSHAFHSPLVAAAVPRLEEALAAETWETPRRRVISTITGQVLDPQATLAPLLAAQVTSPVRFVEALQLAAEHCDVFLEVGPGEVLTGLARATVTQPILALDVGGPSLAGLLQASGALWALGASIRPAVLFADRYHRPLDLDHQPALLSNPCEEAPRLGEALARATRPPNPPASDDPDLAPPSLATTVVSSATSPLEVVHQLVCQRTELPISAVDADSRMLSDLHLSSITVGALVSEAARQLELPPPAAPNEYANATLGTIAQAFEEQLKSGGGGGNTDRDTLPAGVDQWVRAFTVELLARDLEQRPSEMLQGGWQVFGSDRHALRATLPEVLAQAAPGGGIVLLLAVGDTDRQLDLILEAARTGLDLERFLLVHHGHSAAAMARTLHLESPSTAVGVICLPALLGTGEEEGWCHRIAAEAKGLKGYREATYDLDGQRWEPRLRTLSEPPGQQSQAPPLEADEVLVVSGGGKGIGAECALALAQSWGVRLAILGRSEPQQDSELAENLQRFAAQGVTARYFVADVGDATAVAHAISAARAELGEIRGLVHSAGANRPQLLANLGRADVEGTLAPKVAGLDNLLAAIDCESLKLLVGFGSIIARSGMPGEAHYALANERLRRRLEGFAELFPECRSLCVEWSVWSGVGMGERLSQLEALARQGITPIPLADGVAALLQLLERPTPVAVLVSSRFGEPPTLEIERPEMPLLRFLERRRVHVPDVELVVDCAISEDTDPYLADHIFDGERLFPAVMGLEAMTQAWTALTGGSGPPQIRDIRFAHPITVAKGSTAQLRLAALTRPDGATEVVLRSAATGFAVDHFRAIFEPVADPATQDGADDDVNDLCAVAMAESQLLPLEPQRDLYGPVLFQQGMFQRLRGYRWLRARACLAEVEGDPRAQWFSTYLPSELLLGDPGARDATIHAIQACIPHATVLPVALAKLELGEARLGERRVFGAWERQRNGKTLIYDLEVRYADGRLAERWRGLELRVVDQATQAPPLAEPLLGPYLERRLGDLLPEAELSVVINRDQTPQAERRQRSDQAIKRLVGVRQQIFRRPDGKPELPSGHQVSIAHAGDLLMAVSSCGPIGCDVEAVAERSEELWSDLLGKGRLQLLQLMMRKYSEDRDRAATRLWTVLESLKKAGRAPDAPLTLVDSSEDGWLTFASGRHWAASVVMPATDGGPATAFAVLSERPEC